AVPAGNGARPARARAPRLLRPLRPVRDADGSLRGHPPPRRVGVGARGAARRLRGDAGGGVARPAADTGRPAARRGAPGRRDRRRAGGAARPRRALLGGDVDAGYRYVLEPTGVTLEELRARPEGVRVPLRTRYRKYAEDGFATAERPGRALRGGV